MRPKSIGLGHLGCSACFSAGWELRSHTPRAWNRLGLSQEQSAHSGFDLCHCLLLPELIPGQLGHFTPSWHLYLSLRLHLLIGTSRFSKHNHFLYPPPKKSHIGFFFSSDTFNIQNWALILLKASSNSLYFIICHLFLSVHSLNFPDFDLFFPCGLGKLWTLFLFAQVWAQEPYSPSQFRGSASSSSQ